VRPPELKLDELRFDVPADGRSIDELLFAPLADVPADGRLEEDLSDIPVEALFPAPFEALSDTPVDALFPVPFDIRLETPVLPVRLP
jgi:hypothetical protein